MQSYLQWFYVANVTEDDSFVHPQMNFASLIQPMVDEHMQQLFLASSTGSASQMATTPSAFGSATTISGL